MHCHGQCGFVFKHPLGSLLVLRLRYPPGFRTQGPQWPSWGGGGGGSCNPSAAVGRKAILQASLQALPATEESLTARRTCRQACKMSMNVLCQLLLGMEATLQIWSSSGATAIPLMWPHSRESWHVGVVPCYLWWCRWIHLHWLFFILKWIHLPGLYIISCTAGYCSFVTDTVSPLLPLHGMWLLLCATEICFLLCHLKVNSYFRSFSFQLSLAVTKGPTSSMSGKPATGEVWRAQE